MTRVAIIGGGFSGTAVAIHLLRSNQADLQVTVVEPRGRLGTGLAYSTPDPRHLLNVPAGKMSLFADTPDDFVDWLASESHPARADDFVPRRWYGDYVEARFRTARDASACSFVHSQTRALGMANGTEIRFETGTERFDHVVLAWGYAGSMRGARLGLSDPFAPETWPAQAKQIVITGTGLTAADAALTAAERFPQARIQLVSPSGKLPEVHADHGNFHGWTRPRPQGLKPLAEWIRSECATSGDWQMVFEALRPEWNAIWLDLGPGERERFLRHGARVFNRYRHRIPRQTVQLMRAYGDRIQISHGRVEGQEPGRGVCVRAAGSRQWLPADLAIDASGPDFRLRDLEYWGLKPGPHGLGVEARIEGWVSGYPRVYALGPLLRGVLWESTAVRELRVQARDIASMILGS